MPTDKKEKERKEKERREREREKEKEKERKEREKEKEKERKEREKHEKKEREKSSKKDKESTGRKKSKVTMPPPLPERPHAKDKDKKDDKSSAMYSSSNFGIYGSTVSSSSKGKRERSKSGNKRKDRKKDREKKKNRRSKPGPSFHEMIKGSRHASRHSTNSRLSATSLKGDDDKGWKTLSFQSYSSQVSELAWVSNPNAPVKVDNDTDVGRAVYDSKAYGELEHTGYDSRKHRTGTHVYSSENRAHAEEYGLYAEEPYSDEDEEEFIARMNEDYAPPDEALVPKKQNGDEVTYASDEELDEDDNLYDHDDEEGFGTIISIDVTKILREKELSPAAAVMGGKPDRQGWLLKKGSGITSWKRRYFVLKDHILCYFTSEKETKPLGIIMIDNCRISTLDKKSGKRHFAFCITHEKRDSYVLAAEDQGAVLTWVKFLRAAAHKVSEVDMAGYLTKQGGGFKSWKRRLFVLRSDILFYFKPHESMTLAGFIPLEGATVAGAYSDTKKDFAFKIMHPDRRTFFIFADNEDEMDAWMGAIEFASKRRAAAPPAAYGSAKLGGKR